MEEETKGRWMQLTIEPRLNRPDMLLPILLPSLDRGTDVIQSR